MRANRRLARSVVLVLFLLAFVGPWGTVHNSHGPTRRLYFPKVVQGVVGRPLRWPSLLIAGIVALPVACLATVLAPRSRLPAIAYRLLTVVMAAVVGVFAGTAAARGVPLSEFLADWGPTLYLATALLAVGLEATPKRQAQRHDYANVFR